jgi:putative PIG3 family NAD(P)H quinone oxidoreductase
MALPDSMTGILVREAGEPEVMSPQKMDLPSVGSREVLIRTHYAGVNRPDVFQRQGSYPPPAGASAILGLEVSGEVVSVGQDVTDWRIGDQLCALTNGGGYAEYVSVPASQCLPIPKGLSLAQAASLPETYFTVWSTVFMQAQLQSNERFLVHGGSSGIGTAAIQLAKAFGAEVFTTAGSDEKCAFCQSLGADLAINYQTEDYVERIGEHLQGDGINVVLDMVAGDYVQRNLKLCAMDARVIIIAGLRGYKTQLNLLPLMTKRINLTGATLRPRSAEYKAKIATELSTNVWPVLEKGRISAPIDSVFSLHDAVKAHHLMESSKHMGKILLRFI